MFRGLKKRAWKQVETLEWKLKRNVAPVPSEMVRSLAQEEGAIRALTQARGKHECWGTTDDTRRARSEARSSDDSGDRARGATRRPWTRALEDVRTHRPTKQWFV
jgi:hypothetical protein